MRRIASALLCMTVSGAMATANASPAQTPETAADVALDEITITGATEARPGPNLAAQSQAGARLPLTVMETPASVDVIPGKIMQDRGQTNLQQAIAQDAVGVSFIGEPGDGVSGLSMRGFTGAQAITRLYDGVRLYAGAGAVTFPFDVWTVDRVEVLRGPASVLHGEGAIGGAVNVSPKNPRFEGYRHELLATAGSFGMFGMGASSAGPISDSVAYTADIVGRGTRGWMERGDARSLAFSGAIAWKATDTLQFTLSQDYGHDEPSGYFATPLVEGRLMTSLRKRNFNVADNILRFQDNITQLRARWTPLDGVEISSQLHYVASDKTWRNVENYAWQGATREMLRNDYIAIRHKLEQYGNRTAATVRSTVLGLDNTTTIGFELTHIAFKKQDNAPYPGESTVPLFGGSPGFFGPHALRTTVEARTSQHALFADNRLKLTDRLSLVAGLRYDSPHLQRDNPAVGDSLTTTLDSLNWRVGAVYMPADNVAIYGQYARASEPVASVLGYSDAVRNLRLPTGDQVEAGLKINFLNGRGEATFAAYHIIRKDMLSRDPYDVTIVRQIGQQSSRGVEAALGIDLGRGLRLDVNGALLRARYDSFLQAGGVFTGNTPANVPEQTANIWLSWRFLDSWTVTGGLQYVGRTFANDANTATRPAYTVVNAGLSWQASDTAQLDLNVHNLFDEVYATSGSAHHTATAAMWRLGAPRTASLTLRMTF